MELFFVGFIVSKSIQKSTNPLVLYHINIEKRHYNSNFGKIWTIQYIYQDKITKYLFHPKI